MRPTSRAGSLPLGFFALEDSLDNPGTAHYYPTPYHPPHPPLHLTHSSVALLCSLIVLMVASAESFPASECSVGTARPLRLQSPCRARTHYTIHSRARAARGLHRARTYPARIAVRETSSLCLLQTSMRTIREQSRAAFLLRQVQRLRLWLWLRRERSLQRQRVRRAVERVGRRALAGAWEPEQCERELWLAVERALRS